MTAREVNPSVPAASAPAMHNRVHVWVGGGMAPGSSPNDPVFFLNHCFVDKIWHDWQQAAPDHLYAPTGQSVVGGETVLATLPAL